MPQVQMKTGEIVEVDRDKLENFLYENQDKIQIRKVARRGKARRIS